MLSDLRTDLPTEQRIDQATDLLSDKRFILTTVLATGLRNRLGMDQSNNLPSDLATNLLADLRTDLTIDQPTDLAEDL